MRLLWTNKEKTLKKLKKKPSKGQLFREANGYSLTQQKLLEKHNCISIDEYRKKRRERKKGEAEIRKSKHSKSKALRGSKTNSKKR